MMMGFVTDQDEVLVLKICEVKLIFARVVEGGMKSLDGSEKNVDVMIGGHKRIWEILDSANFNGMRINNNRIFKKVFGAEWISKVVASFSKNVGVIDEKEKV